MKGEDETVASLFPAPKAISALTILTKTLPCTYPAPQGVSKGADAPQSAIHGRRIHLCHRVIPFDHITLSSSSLHVQVAKALPYWPLCITSTQSPPGASGLPHCNPSCSYFCPKPPAYLTSCLIHKHNTHCQGVLFCFFLHSMCLFHIIHPIE